MSAIDLERSAARADSPSPDRARALANALAHLGVACRVEARGRAAFLVPEAGVSPNCFEDVSTRQTVMAVGRDHGFSHVAVMLGEG